MRPSWIIIDGYSLLFRLPAATPSPGGELARRRLIVLLEKAAGLLANRITVVFDGRGCAPDAPPDSPAVEVLYSPAHQTADTVIERMVSAAPDRRGILVVTSDRAERHTVEAAGAATMSCGDFLEQCNRAVAQLERLLRQRPRKDRGATLGDFFPEQE